MQIFAGFYRWNKGFHESTELLSFSCAYISPYLNFIPFIAQKTVWYATCEYYRLFTPTGRNSSYPFIEIIKSNLLKNWFFPYACFLLNCLKIAQTLFYFSRLWREKLPESVTLQARMWQLLKYLSTWIFWLRLSMDSH